MKDLRNLLIDCRIELRKLVRDFHKTELCERLDAAMQRLGNAPAGAAVPPTSAPAAPPAKQPPPNQVALAWQTVARDLKFSDPALYDTLSKKVMQRLETKAMVDPTTELHELGKEVAQMQTRQAKHEKSYKALENERDTLLGALAMAVPELSDGRDRVAVALARIEWLKSAKSKPAPKSPRTTGERKAVTAAPPEPEDAGPAPSDTVLQAVAAGSRKFTDAHREWCVGEAMVLSGFQFTPLELIEQGDAAIAQIIVDARKPKS